MTSPAVPTVQLQPLVGCPQQMASGEEYLVSVDLQLSESPRDWPYEEEEFPFTCVLDGGRHFTVETVDDVTVVLHRFGGTYGPARFVVRTRSKPGSHELWLTITTHRGAVIRTDKLPVAIVESAPVEETRRLTTAVEWRTTETAAAEPASVLDPTATYFLVLVALCEPQLRDLSSDVVPTVGEIVGRLAEFKVTSSAVQQHIEYLANDKLRGGHAPDRGADWKRAALIARALRDNLVRQEHLALLPQRAAPASEPSHQLSLEPPFAELLRPERQIVAFRGRNEELSRLMIWCKAPGPRVLLLTGAGGQGKTRLAIELANRLRERGQTFTFFYDRVDDRELLKRPYPTLLIIDYADVRTDQLRPLLYDLATESTKVLLLARSSDVWWDELRFSVPRNVRQDLMALTDLETTSEGRHDAFSQAMRDMAGALAVEIGQIPAPDLSAPQYGRPLSLHVAALLTLSANECAAKGLTATELGNYEQALDSYKQALTLRQEVGDHAGTADILHRLAILAHGHGEYGQALGWYQQAADFNTELTSQRQIGLRAAEEGATELLFMLLARYPDQVYAVIDEIRRRQKMRDQARLDLFSKLVNDGFIQEADIEPLRQLILQPIEGIPSPDFGHRLLLAVDAVGYAGSTDHQQVAIHEGLLKVMDDAADRAGLNRSQWFTQSTGDGELSILPVTEPEPRVADDFVRHLHAALRRHNRDLTGNRRLRLRLAIHYGTAIPGPNGLRGSDPLIASRLCDSPHLRAALAMSGADLAVILSRQLFEDTIVQEHTSLDPGDFRKARIQVKEFDDDAWIWVPGHDVHGLALPPEQNLPPLAPVREKGNTDPARRWLITRNALGGGTLDEAEIGSYLALPVPTCRQIAVVSVRGGAGKTTIAALTAEAIADHREDRVLAVDADSGLGTLPLRLGVQSQQSIRDLVSASPRSWEEVSAYIAHTGKLWVLSNNQPEFDLDTFRTATGTLGRYFSTALIDCGAGVLGQLQRGVMETAHAQLLVTPSTVDGALSARSAVDWFAANGHTALLSRTVIVMVSHTPHADDTGLTRAQEMMGSGGQPVIHLPYDRHLALGVPIDKSRLAAATVAAVNQIAAAAFIRSTGSHEDSAASDPAAGPVRPATDVPTLERRPAETTQDLPERKPARPVRHGNPDA
jgi:MinD-like ATPase involved in chromosome partitioning or flagellar assembly/tetratricopeptide (TPR) repeat protein